MAILSFTETIVATLIVCLSRFLTSPNLSLFIHSLFLDADPGRRAERALSLSETEARSRFSLSANALN